MADDRALLPPDHKLSRPMRFFLIVISFMAIGPAVGGLVAWCMFLVLAYMRQTVGRVDAWPNILGTVLLFAYPIGAPFAAIAGIAHAVSAIWLQKISVVLPIVAALIANVPLLVVGSLSAAYREFLFYPIVVLPASLVASIVCWRLTRNS
jgi:hypothetical protein